MKKENRNLKKEEKKSKKPIDKMKVAKTLIVSLIIIFMLFSICGTLMFYFINR